MTALTSSDLTELRRLMEAATPGPWDCHGTVLFTDPSGDKSRACYAEFSAAPSAAPFDLVANAELAAAALNALPALLPAVEERDAALARAERAEAERDAALAVKSIADAPAALHALFGNLTDALLDVPSDGPEAMFIEADSARMQAEAERDALKAENARLRALISEAREAIEQLLRPTPSAGSRIYTLPDGRRECLTAREFAAAKADTLLARLKETTDAAE